MSGIKLVRGSFSEIKKAFMMYCLEHFEHEEIWLLDSMQVFDPYMVSRIDVAAARRMLSSIKVSRPFTIYQLKEKVFSLSKMSLHERSTIIVSGIDCFEDELKPAEKDAHVNAIRKALCRIQESTRCKLLIGTAPIEHCPIGKAGFKTAAVIPDTVYSFSKGLSWDAQ